MAQTVLITLTLAGTDVGPFDLYSDADGYASAFATGVSRAALLAGYVSSVVPDLATTIKAQSYGTCTNYLYLVIDSTTTTTTSSSTSSTSTSTTTLPTYSVSMFATNENSPSDSFKVQFSTVSNTGPWTSCTPTVNDGLLCLAQSPSGGGSGTIDVLSGTVVYFRLVDSSINPIRFAYILNSDCDLVNTAVTYCVATETITATTNIAFKAIVDAGTGAYTSCP